MKKNIFLALLFLVLIPFYKVKAYCADSEMIRLQRIAKNVNTSYSYDETKGRFIITITNLKKDLILKNLDNGNDYNVDGEITFRDLFPGTHTYIIYAKNNECTEDSLITKYVALPYRNVFYNSDECEGIENYSYCAKWIEHPTTQDVWRQKITNYKENIEQKDDNKKTKNKTFLYEIYDLITENLIKYYYIILPIFIIICLIVIIKKSKEQRLV